MIGLTHRATPNIRTSCDGVSAGADCFVQTRRTFITGVFQEGALESLRGKMNYYDGIEARLIRVLVFLRDTQDTSGGWGSYLSPSNCNGTRNATAPCSIVWEKLIVAGHSQGAGHAAVIARDHTVDTVVMLAGPTDHRGKTIFPSYTLSGGLATPAGGGNYRGLVHTDEEFYTAATTHWGPDRLNAGSHGHTTSNTTENCYSATRPNVPAHSCVVTNDMFYGIWESFWPWPPGLPVAFRRGAPKPCLSIARPCPRTCEGGPA
ncbi:hypothetical protein JQX13_39900 [Archangium violaceum]|uniref:hypothetical protein n=1 Tax=Archangium violaceum TaxID=83451 RepID=UPI00193B663D|nr:hypothetical protein [Archangium violaceum]QRK06225.1 hypothetical protein JQX13_39900 [Archangium violaceum]